MVMDGTARTIYLSIIIKEWNGVVNYLYVVELMNAVMPLLIPLFFVSLF
jgi:hypothetical protein